MIIVQSMKFFFFLADFRFLNMKGMSQRKFDTNRIKYCRKSSLDGATSGNGKDILGAVPSCLQFPGALFRAS